ncbi:hypothetical protein [Alishewanella longhuensis]
MDMSVLIALPVIIPLIFGALSLVVLNNHGAQRLLGMLGTYCCFSCSDTAAMA